MKKLEVLKNMSITKKLLILTFVSLLILGCAPDIYVDPPHSLKGFYIGRLYVIENYSQGGSATEYMEVEWTFFDYRHECETSMAMAQTLNICDFIGNYNLDIGVVFTSTTTNVPETCNDELMPIGSFPLRWINVEEGNDTLIIEQVDVDNDVRSWAVLERQPDLK